MKDGALTMLAGIAADKNLLLGGQPTQRIEHTVAPAAEAWGSFVEHMRQEVRERDAIDVPFEPVGTGSASAQKASALLAPAIEIETGSTEESER
jgi:hypothetical protein